MRKKALSVVVAACLSLSVLFGCASEGEAPVAPAANAATETPKLFIAKCADKVGERLQMPELAGGCEIAALISVLEAMGQEVDLHELVDEHLPMEGGWSLASSYSGSPYFFGSGFPAVIARCANSYFTNHDVPASAVSHRGMTFESLLDQLDQGKPVLVWTTMEMQPVMHTETYSDGYEWYDNEHCVCVYGQDEKGDLLVSDPLDGLVVRDKALFREIFDECGGLAVTFLG